MMKSHLIPNVCSEYSEHYFRDYHSVIPKSTYPIAWSYYNLLPAHWLAIWRIFRRSPLSEENYPNRNPAWKQALLIIDFQGNTRKDSSTFLSAAVSSPFFFTPCCARLFFCCLRKVSVEQRLWTISRTVAAGVKIHLCSSPLLG